MIAKQQLAQAIVILGAGRAAMQVRAHPGNRRVGVGVGAGELELDVAVELVEALLTGELGSGRS